MPESYYYDLMKICIVVANADPERDYEDIWNTAKGIYTQWQNAKDLNAEEYAYVQKYAERIMSEV